MPRLKARLKDIAEKTGFGTNTVSLALRGSTRISMATRQKILKAARELNYVPNNIAKSLVSRRSNTVGLILHEITNPVLTSAAEQIQLALAARGYSVLFSSSNGQLDEERRAIEVFRSRMVDGLLIYPVAGSGLAHLQRLRNEHFPIVLLVDIPDSGIDAVGIDEFAGGYEATRHLIEQGHRRIGIIGGHQQFGGRKFLGYRKALSAAGIKIDRQISVPAKSHTIQAGIDAMHEIMNVPDAPTAIFATSDILGLGALRWASVNDVRVPKDLAIMGFDDIDGARHAVTPLSTINNDGHELAANAVARLMQLIEAKDELPEPITKLLHGKLVVRESTAARRRTGAPRATGKAAASVQG